VLPEQVKVQCECETIAKNGHVTTTIEAW